MLTKLQEESRDYWNNMSFDDVARFNELPGYMQNHIARLAYYANEYFKQLEKENE